MSSPIVDVSITSSTPSGYVMGFGTGAMCSGIDKLVQNVLIELFTEVGSKPFNPKAGTVFLKALKSRTIFSEFDVAAAFTASAADIRQKFRKEQTISTPLSERLVNLSLANVTLMEDNVLLTIKIENGAGTTSDIVTAAGVLF